MVSLNVAPVSPLGITAFNPLGTFTLSMSNPNVLVLWGDLFNISTPSLEMVALKKLLAGFLASLIGVKSVGTKFALNWKVSPLPPASPSSATTPIFALTGKGAGNVLKPLTLKSTCGKYPGVFTSGFTPTYPSKIDINLLGTVGLSYTTTRLHPPAPPPARLPLDALTLPTVYVPLASVRFVIIEVTSLKQT